MAVRKLYKRWHQPGHFVLKYIANILRLRLYLDLFIIFHKRIVRYVFILIMNKINAPKKVSENITSTKQYIFYTKHRQSVWVGVISCIIFDLPSSRYPDIPRGVLTDNSLIDIKTAPVYQACEIKPSWQTMTLKAVDIVLTKAKCYNTKTLSMN